MRDVGRYQRGNQKPKIGQQNTMTKRKRTRARNELQNTTLKTDDWATQTHLITRVNSGATKKEAVPTPLVTLVMWLIFSIGYEENENLPKLWLQLNH